MSDAISDKDRLFVEARQWLQVFVDEYDIDPDTTRMEAMAIGPKGTTTFAMLNLGETLRQMDEIKFTITTRADNDD